MNRGNFVRMRKLGAGPEQLRVFDLSVRFAGRVEALLDDCDAPAARVRQVVEAADSIVLNTAEAAWYGSDAMRIRHFTIARASAGECHSGLRLIAARNRHIDFRPIYSDARMIIKMLGDLITKSSEPHP